MVRGCRSPRAGPGRAHTVGDVRHYRGAHRGRRARAGGRCDHRAHRARVRRTVQDQRAAHGHDGHSRRAGRSISRSASTESPSTPSPPKRTSSTAPWPYSSAVCCSTPRSGFLLFIFLGGRSLIGHNMSTTTTPRSRTPMGRRVPARTGLTVRQPAPPGADRWGRDGDQVAGADRKSGGNETRHASGGTFEQIATLVGLAALALFSLVLDLDVGFVSMTVAVVLALLSPESAEGGDRPDQLVDGVAHRRCSDLHWSPTRKGPSTTSETLLRGLGMPLLVALLLCYIGAIVSVFASSTAILGATIRSPYPSSSPVMSVRSE